MIKSRRKRWAGRIARMGEKRNAYRILVGTPEEKRLLGIPAFGWVVDTEMDFRGIGWGGMNWIDLAQNRNN
jgi:hypothetical protein